MEENEVVFYKEAKRSAKYGITSADVVFDKNYFPTQKTVQLEDTIVKNEYFRIRIDVFQ